MVAQPDPILVQIKPKRQEIRSRFGSATSRTEVIVHRLGLAVPSWIQTNQNAVLHDKLVVLLMSRGAGPGGPTPSTTATGRIISLETWAALGRVTTMP